MLALFGCSPLLDLGYEYRDDLDSALADGGLDGGFDGGTDASTDGGLSDASDADRPDATVDCMTTASGIGLSSPVLAYNEAGRGRIAPLPFELVQVLAIDGQFFVSRRTDEDYEVREVRMDGEPGPSMSVAGFLDSVDRNGDCLGGGPFLDVYLNSTEDRLTAAAASPSAVDEFTLSHLSPSGECSSASHSGRAEGFLRANDTTALTRRSAPGRVLNSVAFAGARSDANGYLEVFAQDALPGIHVVFQQTASMRLIDYQRNGQSVVNRYDLGSLIAPPVIAPAGSGWAVFYGADGELKLDIVSSALDREDPVGLVAIGDRIGVAAQGAESEPWLLVTKHPTLPTRAIFSLMDGVLGTPEEVFEFDMPEPIDAIDVVYNAGVFAIALDSSALESRTTRVLLAESCN
ncbi:MAG: hypothetical protein AAGE52_41990 [Myxococcota bacterium]